MGSVLTPVIAPQYILPLYKDPVVNEFYDELLKHWSVRQDVASDGVVVDLEGGPDDDDDDDDLSMFFRAKSEVDEEQEGVQAPADPYMCDTLNSPIPVPDDEMESSEKIKTGEEENDGDTEGKDKGDVVEENPVAPVDDPYQDHWEEHALETLEPLGESPTTAEPTAENLVETKTVELSGQEIQQRIWRLKFLEH